MPVKPLNVLKSYADEAAQFVSLPRNKQLLRVRFECRFHTRHGCEGNHGHLHDRAQGARCEKGGLLYGGSRSYIAFHCATVDAASGQSHKTMTIR